MTRDAADEELVMLSFRVPRALKRRLEEMTAASGVSMQEIARQALEAELELREEVLDERRAVFARLAAAENERRLAKRARRRSEHADPRTP